MRTFGLITVVLVLAVCTRGAVIPDYDIQDQGLYSNSDHVIILTNRNFDRKVYGQKHALVVQFYNSYCGHCRAFSPKYKSLANDIKLWKSVVRLAVVDCSVEENNEVCRQFEIMAYPSIRYLHEDYLKANSNIGDRLNTPNTAAKLKSHIVAKMREEQTLGRMQMAQPMSIASYDSYATTLWNVPSNIIHTFLVFENDNSSVGSELILDLNEYNNILVKRVYETAELSKKARINKFPALVAVKSDSEGTIITPRDPTKEQFLQAINSYLTIRGYKFPKNDLDNKDIIKIDNAGLSDNVDSDLVYYRDLEHTLKTSLHTEITRYKTLSGEPLQALINYLEVLISSFPFRLNLKEYITDVRNHISMKSSWSGSEVYELVKMLQSVHAPVFSSDLDYVRCKGSEPRYRGYSCGLWTLFHTLTVNAAQGPGTKGPKVLQVMHGYIKNFFGCTECAEHFQAMAARNRLFDVKENDKAILWLWIAHNEVNLRLAGDVTEDPKHPKIQFPSVLQCPDCRLSRGAWNLPAVYEYLHNTYSMENIRDIWRSHSASSPSPFTDLDLGMLSLLYILSFIFIILVLQYFFTKRYYRLCLIKPARGKV